MINQLSFLLGRFQRLQVTSDKLSSDEATLQEQCFPGTKEVVTLQPFAFPPGHLARPEKKSLGTLLNVLT